MAGEGCKKWIVAVRRQTFDDVFQAEGIERVRTPFRAPQANGVAERFVRTVRTECLDWLLILNQQHLEGTLSTFVRHYNTHRPHRGLALRPPQPALVARASVIDLHDGRVQRRDRLGGLVHEYVLAA
jgi:transposase InsO family protein